MGREVGRVTFTARDYALFRARLTEGLTLLEKAVEHPHFGTAPATLGAELEVSLIGPDACPVPVAAAVREASDDDRLSLEVARFNLEVNLTPVPVRGHPFTALAEQTSQALKRIASVSLRHHGARAVPMGTLPTLTPPDVTAQALTDQPRFRALERAWARRRSTPFILPVGEQGLLRAESVAVQGAACSWQTHLTVTPNLFSRTFNAAQLATGPALAASGNSPFPLGHPGWQEARIPLYERGFGDRCHPGAGTRRPRVGFGRDWMRGGPQAAFAEAVRCYDVLLPAARADAAHMPGGYPVLEELRLHLSTVWWWNRPVYDPLGHLRIEFRALPSGPTPVDMAANTAFLVGLTLFLAAEGRDVARELPFACARTNFYRAARDGLRASLWWPTPGSAPREHHAGALIKDLLPRARDGLALAAVDADEADTLLGVLDQRVTTGHTGAWWQQRTREVLRRRRASAVDACRGPAESPSPGVRTTSTTGRDDAMKERGACGDHRAEPLDPPRPAAAQRPPDLVELTLRYALLAEEAAPVHTWKPPALPPRSQR
ncbi:Glutamate--cysteine ligase [Streptomyces hundungensis]|uniref:Glutamate--cysteine ligase n=1 Tax=Streptomyces hundungensis TaxID=1077946 RepID=A0A387H3V8_9ACTN|nr:glutamate--cysteine ligase [Streptomyces hundungensis]AYG78376.1 Glutamate--cysteine ligase [Streptomyces hundungensis]